MMPSVPAARAPEYLCRRSFGRATWPMVAAVASEEPRIAPKPAPTRNIEIPIGTRSTGMPMRMPNMIRPTVVPLMPCP